MMRKIAGLLRIMLLSCTLYMGVMNPSIVSHAELNAKLSIAYITRNNKILKSTNLLLSEEP